MTAANPESNQETGVVSAAHEHIHAYDDASYDGFLTAVQKAFDNSVSLAGKLFTTASDGLYEVYLDSMPSGRQYHTCHTCRRFIESYGGLVAIAEDGTTRSALWETDVLVPEFYQGVTQKLASIVRKSRVTGVFLSGEKVWGIPVTGNWTHLAVKPPAEIVFAHPIKSAFQAIAAKKEDFNTVALALSDFKTDMLEEAMRILQAEAVSRSEKFVAPVQFLLDLQHNRTLAKSSILKENILWRAIAGAPDGFCHPRASVIGSLLEDIKKGLPFEDIKRKFNSKVGGLVYQRPTAAPTVGNLAAAEKIAEKLGIGPSLERRYARLDEIQTIWMPKKTEEEKSDSLFGHLKPKTSVPEVKHVKLPTQKITWEKFVRTVLSSADEIELYVSNATIPFIALVTAVNPDAPPILKWDREEQRNPISWYVKGHPGHASAWNITSGWKKVNAVSTLPNLWGDHPQPFISEGAILIVDKAVDQTDAGNCLFPEILRGELHEVRSVIEAYSKKAKLSGREDSSASGWDIRKGQPIDCLVRVTVAGRTSEYKIDRWD